MLHACLIFLCCCAVFPCFRRKNALDIELHKLASELLQQQRSRHDAAGKLLKLPQVTARELEEKPRVKKERGADNLSVSGTCRQGLGREGG